MKKFFLSCTVGMHYIIFNEAIQHEYEYYQDESYIHNV